MTDRTSEDREPCRGDTQPEPSTEKPLDMSLEDCHQVMDRLEEYLDRAILPDDQPGLETHLRLCDHCTQEYDLLHRAQEILRAKLCDERCPESLRATISAMIHEECEGC